VFRLKGSLPLNYFVLATRFRITFNNIKTVVSHAIPDQGKPHLLVFQNVHKHVRIYYKGKRLIYMKSYNPRLVHALNSWSFVCGFQLGVLSLLFVYSLSSLHFKCSFINAPSSSYSMVTNKTDIVRFQRCAHHRRIWKSPGRFLIIFFCVVTYRTGTVRCLYMKTSAGALPAL